VNEDSLEIDITPSLTYDVNMHRTTVNLDEAVYLRVKAMAKRNGKSLARTIEDLLRSALGSDRAGFVEVPLHGENGPLPGVDIADRERLYDLMEGR
jgi:hypothetical protein